MKHALAILVGLWLAATVATAHAGQTVRDLVRTGESHRVAGNILRAEAAFKRAVRTARAGSDAQRYAAAALGALQADEGLAGARSTLLHQALGLPRGIGAEPLTQPFEVVAMAHLARTVIGDPLEDAEVYARRAADAARLPLIVAFAQQVLAEVRIARGQPRGAAAPLAAAWQAARGADGAVANAAILSLANTALDALAAGVPGAGAIADQAIARVVAADAPSLRAEGLLVLARRTAPADPRAALDQTGQALALAQTVGNARTLFRVSRTRAEIALRLGDRAVAGRAYAAAFGNLRRLRANMYLGFDQAGQSVYRREAGAFHAAYTRFLLDDPAPDLGQVILVSEDLKATEVEEYFRAECRRGTFEVGSTDLFGPETAVLYPVILNDRLEMLLILGKSVHRAPPVRITPDELATLVGRARTALEGRDPGVKAHLRRLHDRVFRGTFDYLSNLRAGIDSPRVGNIFYVADGVLRNFPLGALHDGERYLVQKYVFASALGMTLRTTGKRFDASQSIALVAGAPNTPDLPDRPLRGVASETRQVADLFARFARSADRRLDTEIGSDDIVRVLTARPYNVIHLSAHAWFDGSSVDAFGGGGFIGLHDRGLKVGEFVEALLQRNARHNQPVDLLVLSACGTAGDNTDRAPLGIAGAAYRANVASVVATLWPVYDISADRISRRFYLNLLGQQAADPHGDETGPMGRARALAMAQRWFIEKLVPQWNRDRAEDWSHPAFWAPFVLIGQPDF